MAMTPEAKKALSITIRGLRQRLLEDLRLATESAYRLSVRAQDAGLDEAAKTKRRRLDNWLDEQLRAQAAGGRRRQRDDFLREAEQQAAYTLLNRLLILRLMEEPGPSGQPLRKPALIKGGWGSTAYQDFRDLARGVVRDDPTEGFSFLLQLVFEELAEDLPGLFGSAGIGDLIPIPPATLRHAVEELNKDELESCWTDDMTLGWVYQYWNDPERERLDTKINDGGKIEPHEIASKTQMFTERYMVDWMLQNSLGLMWFTLCKKNGWVPEVQTNGTLQRLEERRIEWRAKRAAGEVSLTDLMPLETEEERRWAYFLRGQEIPDEAVELAPATVREWKILDPAVGSGHFLVVALGMLLALFQEEARQRGEADEPKWSEKAIVEHVLAHTLHGIDIDPRAVQIAAASLWLKSKILCPGSDPERFNLVAPRLRIADLPEDDPALMELREDIDSETGISIDLINQVLLILQGIDSLGTLLRIDEALDCVIKEYAHRVNTLQRKVKQFSLLPGSTSSASEPEANSDFSALEARSTLQKIIDDFLHRHSSATELGLRLRGDQLASGLLFSRICQNNTYDLVIANPPYLGSAKLDGAYLGNSGYLEAQENLYTCFLERCLELSKRGGIASQVTLSGWMYIGDFAEFRQKLFDNNTLRAIAELRWSSFESMKHDIVCMYCITKHSSLGIKSHGVIPMPLDEREESLEALAKKQAGLLAHSCHVRFFPGSFGVVPKLPLVFWWTEEDLELYTKFALMGEVSPARQGLATANNARFLRLPWEPDFGKLAGKWYPYVKGGEDREWLEPTTSLVLWKHQGLEINHFFKNGKLASRPQNQEFYNRVGVAFTKIGASFKARAYWRESIFDVAGSSVFPETGEIDSVTAMLNSSRAKYILESLNPTINFQVGDVNRLPSMAIEGASEILRLLRSAFGMHESHREPSIDFSSPGPSGWRVCQQWAQKAVDRSHGDPLPEYIEELDPEPPTDHLSFALGVALGRFAPVDEQGQPITSNQRGILDPAAADLSHALPAGILFLDGSLEENDHRDDLGQAAAASLHQAWSRHGSAIAPNRGLRDWLRLDFFKDVHRGLYENRPIHWPLSSAKRTFVAWVNIHRMNRQTLKVLLADHLIHGARSRIEGELVVLRQVRDSEDRQVARKADSRIGKLTLWLNELNEFISAVEQCADHGAPPTDGRCPARKQDAVYFPDLDDGVMINSAALWPLLEPQWKDPKKWWKELASAQGKKDYDWAHLAMRYWPSRVDEKCQGDPSLAVAHGCFWRYHPERAWAWELRLQQEIAPDFRIEEAPYCPGGKDLGDEGDAPHRLTWLSEHPVKALAAVEKEATRRMGRGDNRQVVNEMRILESGLWSVIPAKVASMEQRLSDKQGAVFSLRAPDEAEGRAAIGEQAVQPGLALALGASEGAGA